MVGSTDAIAGRSIAFHRIDVADADALAEVFAAHALNGVIHFAGLKAVGESVGKPLEYYANNIGSTLVLLHHPSNTEVTRRPDWIVLAVPPHPVEWLYRDLKAAGVSVERVGDCVAPRRAHSAVIEGERAGAAV